MRYVFCLLLLAASTARAQELRASISGRVTDPTESATPHAKVVATNVETNVAKETETNDAGRYTILFLQPGRYTLTIGAAGFKRFVRENLVLGTSDKAAVDVTLQLGQLAENVTVTAEAPLLETETASRGSLVTTRQIADLPINGRNIYQLAWAAPGVIKASRSWGSVDNIGHGNASDVIINGGIRGQNESILDGVTNTQPNRNVNFMPPVEALAEMKVQTSNYDATYGRLGGGVVAITTKSGTNAFHGSLFETNRVSRFSANRWEANFVGASKVRGVSNNFGFQTDGPLYIPKLLNGRNRLFFMIAYNGTRSRSSGGDSAVIPDAAMRGGDFSGVPLQIYDPLTTSREGSGFARERFAGNRIPAHRINNVGAKVMEFVPLPNLAGRGFGLENYVNFGGAKSGYDQFLGKLDYRVNEKNNLYFSYGRLPHQEFDDILFGTDSPAETSRENPLHRNYYRYVLDWTNALNASNVLNFRAGLARYTNTRGNPAAVGFDPRRLGFADALVSQFSFLHFPRFDMGRYTSVGSSIFLDYSTRDSYSYQFNLNRNQGRHQFKYGVEARLFNENAIAPGNASGYYTFNKGFTQRNPAQADAVSGDEFASFLLGYPADGSRIDITIDPAFRSQYYVAFVHDDFKIHRRVTVNLGFRWDYERPFSERYNRTVRGFAFDQPSPIANRVPGLNLRGGLLFAGSSGESRLAFNPDRNNFQPRLGVAVQLSPNWVIRGGYGLFYLGGLGSGGQPTTGFSAPTPVVSSVDGGNTPRVSLTNAFPEGLLRPQGSSQGLATRLGQDISFGYADSVLPYSHQYSLSIERILPGQFLVEASFSGNETRRFPLGVGLNFIPADQLGRPDSYYRERVPNPLAGLLPLNPSKNGATIVRQDLLVAYPQYTGVGMGGVPIGRNHYHSLQLRAVKRYSQGMTLNLAYTVSKILEELNLLNAQDFNLASFNASRLEKRLAEYDVPQKLAALWTYELPFAKGKRIGGWQANVDVTVQSGFPVNFPNAPNLEPRSARLSSSQRNLFRGFDTTLFPSRPPNLTYARRNFPTRFPDVRLYPLKSVDFSLAKKTRLTERVELEIRSELYNAFNHPWFSEFNSRGTDVTRPEFGWYRLAQRNDARRIGLVARLYW